MCPMLPVYRLFILDCPSVSYVSNVACLWIVHSWLPFCVLCVQCCLSLDCSFLIALLCLMCPMLPVSGFFILDCPSVSYVSNVACLWIVHSWMPFCVLCVQCCLSIDCSFLIALLCLMCPMLPVSGLFILDCPSVSYVSNVACL